MVRKLFWVFILGLQAACASDSTAAQELAGRWELASASIDGEETDRMENLYFEFVNSEVNTNVLGDNGTYPFLLNGTEVQQMSDPEVNYDLTFDSDSTIALTTEIRGRAFVFKLLRAEILNEASEVL